MIDIDVKHPSLQFTKDEVEQILGQFNRTLDNVQVDVDCVKTWIKTQPHLCHTPADRIIMTMLIRNKFSVEKTKSNLDYYYTLRAKNPEVFFNRFPSNKDIIEMRRILHCFTLPKLINLNRIVFFVLDEMHLQFDGYTNIAKCLIDIEGISISDIHNSVEVIWDCTQSNFTFWTTLTPIMAKIVINIAEKIYSNRMKSLRIIGLPPVAHILVNSAIACLPKKIQERISSCSDPKEIAKFYPEELLPVEFGGSGKPYREMSADFNDMIDQYEEYFQHIQNFKVNETLRPMKLDDDEMLGFHGNFRKLEVD